jgi:hypothetical protein
VGDAELCCMDRNASGAGRNRENGVGTTGTGGIDAGAGLGVDGSWRGRCTKCESAGHVNFDVFSAESACIGAGTIRNVSTTCGGCLLARGDASVCNRGETTSRGVELSGADCRSWRTWVGTTEATSMDEGHSCFGGNVGAASGGIRNDGDASEDKIEGGKTSRGADTRGAQDWSRRVYNAA